jgi:hypothetical protein
MGQTCIIGVQIKEQKIFAIILRAPEIHDIKMSLRRNFFGCVDMFQLVKDKLH